MNNILKRFSAIWFFGFLILAVSSAQVPSTIAVQGQLFQQDGSPVPNGRFPVTIAFHVGIDGDPIIVCQSCFVDFVNGVFQVALGGPDSPLPEMNKQYWVSVSLNGEELLPRVALHSVPFAIASKTAETTPGMIPVGGMLPYAGSDETVHTYFLPADGRGVNSKKYPALYAAIGQRYGDGSADTTAETDFNLPDTRNAFLKGAIDTQAPRTVSDPIAADRVRLDNAAKGSVMEPGVMSTNELVEVLPSASFMFLIRVK